MHLTVWVVVVMTAAVVLLAELVGDTDATNGAWPPLAFWLRTPVSYVLMGDKSRILSPSLPPTFLLVSLLEVTMLFRIGQ